MQARRFFIDTERRSFVASPDAAFTAPSPAFFNEDQEPVELFFLEPTPGEVRQYGFLDYSASTVKLAVGVTAPAALQTTWTSLATTVTASVTSVQTGSSSANAVQRLAFAGRKPAEGGFSLTLPSAPFTGTSLIEEGRISLDSTTFGNIFNGRRVQHTGHDPGTGIQISPTRNGTFFVVNAGRSSFQIADTPDGPPLTITGQGGDFVFEFVTTPTIIDATSEAIGNAIIAAGIVNADNRPLIEISGSYEAGFNLEYVDLLGASPKDNIVVTSTLAAAPGLAATLNFNTNEIAALIAAGNADNLRMEIEVSESGLRQTYQTAAAVADDIITSTSPLPIPAGPTTSTLNFDDGSGGTWAVSVDANGVLTATKQ
jgi:hypothetical protein